MSERPVARAFWVACWALLLIVAAVIGVRAWKLSHGDSGVVAAVALEGPSQIMPGEKSRYVVLARDQRSGRALANEQVELYLTGESERLLGRARTDAAGQASFEIAVQAPELKESPRLVAILPAVDAFGSESRGLYKGMDFDSFLSTDKPQYQPGQTIHVRALSLRDDGRPLVKAALELTIRDPSGTLVHKRQLTTSEFGIAHDDFRLASEVRLGTYTVAAMFGPVGAERRVEVRRYALPKISARLEFDRETYETGKPISGLISASYFFGEPVERAKVRVARGSVFQVDQVLARGETDARGQFRFAADPGDSSSLELVAQIETADGVSAQATGTLRAERVPDVEVIPENGRLVSGLSNRLWIVTSLAGEPRSAEVTVESSRQAVNTDDLGLASLSVAIPDPGRDQREYKLELRVKNKYGTTWSNERTFYLSQLDLILRPESPVLRAGKQTSVEVLGRAQHSGDVLLSIWKDQRRVFSAAGWLQAGHAKIGFELPASVHGLVRLEAQVFTTDGRLLGGRTLALAEPDGGLGIRASFDRAEFGPGGKARLDLAVNDARGTPIRAALGLSAVDEAFFALADTRPDLEKHFFMVETELGRNRLVSEGRYSRLLRADAEENMAPSDAKHDDARRALLAGLAAGLEGTPRHAFDWDASRVKFHERYSREHLGALAAGWSMVFGVLLLAAFAGYVVLRAVRPGDPGQGYAEPWVSAGRQLGLAWALGLLVPPVMIAIAEQMFEDLPTRAEHGVMFGVGLASAIGFALWQYAALRRLRREPLASSVPGYAFALGLLPLGGLLAQAGWGADLSYRLHVGSELFHRYRFELLVALLGALFWQLGFAGFSLIQHAAQGALSVKRRVWLLFSRSALVGAPLTILLAVVMSVENRKYWFAPSSVEDFAEALEREYEPEDGSNREGGTGTRAKGEEGSSGNKRYAVQGPRDNVRRSGGEPRVRSHFPETLAWIPELVTDARGKASIELPLADSITTYRVALSVVGADGSLGSLSLPLRVMQDFFVDVAAPAALTQDDELAIPVTVYNYLDRAERVTLNAESDGFESPAGQQQSLELGPREVRGLRWKLVAKTPGERFLRIVARGSRASDAVERRTKIEPRGVAVTTTRSGSLRGSAREELTIPELAVAGGSVLYAKFYGGLFSQMVEALDGVFQRPTGCFEQTSSSTYPNVLLLAVLRKSQASSPEVEQKALAYIEEGYQRLLTFEAPAGGFGMYRGEKPEVRLTAYGLLELSDMAKVFAVDPELIARSKQWLYGQQQADGSFTTFASSSTDPEARARDALRTTAYVARALAQTGDRDPRLERALDYVKSTSEPGDAYTVALRALALAVAGKPDEARALVKRLLPFVQRRDGDAFWTASDESFWYSRGDSYAVELTALIAQALGLLGEEDALRRSALDYLTKSRDALGLWSSTASTIAALQALLPSMQRSERGDQPISVKVGGAPAGELVIKQGQRDVHSLLGLSQFVAVGKNVVELSSPLASDVGYQLVSTHYLPLEGGEFGESGPLSIGVRYDSKRVRVGSTIGVHVDVRWKRAERSRYGMVEVAVPPGFEPDGLAELLDKKVVNWYSASDGKITFYVPEFAQDAPLKLDFRLRALFPVRALAPSSVAYPYYEPEVRAETRPVLLTAEEP